MLSCSVVSNSTAACQFPLSMGFSPQENWSGLPFPPPRDLPDPGIEPVSPLEKPRGHNSHLLIFDGHPCRRGFRVRL